VGTTYRFIRPAIPTVERWARHLNVSYGSRIFSNFGPAARRLETMLAERFGLGRRAVAVSSCTSGLIAALHALNIGGGKVAVPSFTFPATVQAIRAAGGEPVFCDVAPHTLQICPDAFADVLSRFSGQVRAVVPVRPFGMHFNLDELVQIAREGRVSVVVDAAAGLGAPAARQEANSNLVEVFSFHATKCFAIGEGGAIFAPEESEEGLRSACNFGMRNGVVVGNGINAKLGEFAAAVAIEVLQELSEAVRRRTEIANVYFAALRRSKIVERVWDPHLAPWATFPVLLTHETNAATLVDAAARRGVELRRYYDPLHLIPHFANCDRGVLPVTEDVGTRMLCLPVYSDMSHAEQMDIIGRLEGLLV
jgi:dTDP-4-amino-4,6-dideoxygalactose transaminase